MRHCMRCFVTAPYHILEQKLQAIRIKQRGARNDVALVRAWETLLPDQVNHYLHRRF